VAGALAWSKNGIGMSHGKSKKTPLVRYIYLPKEQIIELWRNAYYIDMFFLYVIGYSHY
jgi:hypothetical protein